MKQAGFLDRSLVIDDERLAIDRKDLWDSIRIYQNSGANDRRNNQKRVRQAELKEAPKA